MRKLIFLAAAAGIVMAVSTPAAATDKNDVLRWCTANKGKCIIHHQAADSIDVYLDDGDIVIFCPAEGDCICVDCESAQRGSVADVAGALTGGGVLNPGQFGMPRRANPGGAGGGAMQR